MKNLQHKDGRTGGDEEVGDSIALLVLERGAEWPSWGTGIRMRAENSAVEVQMDSETTEEFEQRVLARLDLIEKKGLRIVAAGYACALIPSDESGAASSVPAVPSSGAMRRQSRKTICMRILNQFADKDGTELILAGGSWEITGDEGRQRSQLIELWGELSIGAPGRLMSVRFEDPPSESGVFRAAPKLEPLAPESSDLDERTGGS